MSESEPRGHDPRTSENYVVLPDGREQVLHRHPEHREWEAVVAILDVDRRHLERGRHWHVLHRSHSEQRAWGLLAHPDEKMRALLSRNCQPTVLPVLTRPVPGA